MKDQTEQKKAFFIDRDGVLIEEGHYLSDPEQVKLFEVTAQAINKIKKNGYLAIIISNQSGVARGYFGEDDIENVEERIKQILLEDGAEIDAWYYCCHHPKGNIDEYSYECDCRKPEPGMILKAVKEYNIDVSQSFMIGDKFSDLGAAENAGCKNSVLVKTGHGLKEIENNPEHKAIVRDDIKGAVDYLLACN